MTKRIRFDGPGVWHHAMNRGLARRSVFEDRACVRYFLACLARTVHRGLLEVHGYCVMTTHFHLLLRSPNAELSQALKLVQNRYVRWFNRRMRRDGPLFRGRFLSRPIEGAEDRRAVLAYIDRNAVEARIVRSPEQYPHGSAHHYARPSGPIWLERSWVEADATARSGSGRFTLEVYRRAFHARSAFANELVESRLRSTARGLDPLDELVTSAPDRVAAWLREKARLADGTRPGLPCAGASTVLVALERRASLAPSWRLRCGRADLEAWPAMAVGLLRDLAGLSWAEIQRRTDASGASVQRRYANHRAWMEAVEAYSKAAGELGRECLGRSVGNT